MELISVILPVYNIDDSYINAVKSVLKQTYSDFELIIVDDGSPKTLNLREIMHDRRIRHYRREVASGGPSLPRNLGLEHAKGDYITFIDSDDEYAPAFLEKMYKSIKEADLCVCNYSWGKNSHYTVRHGECSQLVEIGDLNIFLLENMRRFPGSVWNCIFRREIVNGLNLRFVDNNELFEEDIVFTVSYLQRCKHVKFISDDLYRYCIRQGSVCDQYKPNDQKQVSRYLRFLYELNDIINNELLCVMFIKAYAYCRSKTSLSEFELMRIICDLQFLNITFKRIERANGSYVEKYWGCEGIAVNKIGSSLLNGDISAAVNLINNIIKRGII